MLRYDIQPKTSRILHLADSLFRGDSLSEALNLSDNFPTVPQIDNPVYFFPQKS
jgi:hypothetical protein